MRDAARTLLVFQAYYQEIAYKCKKMGKLNELKTHFAGENAFLTEVFKTENKEIDSIFPDERMVILSKLININYYKGLSSIDIE
jgi:hypothetical protein